MNDIILEKVKCPFVEDIHGFTKRYAGNSWMDIYGIKYRLSCENGSTLVITSPENNQLIPDTIIEHINALPDGIRVVFNLTREFNVTGLNLLLEYFARKECNKPLVIDVTYMQFGMNEFIPLENLPMNVKVSNTAAMGVQYYGENSFDWWLLRRGEEYFNKVIDKLDNRSKIRALDLQGIVLEFYTKYGDALETMSDREKCDFVFKHLRKTTSFAGSVMIAGEERPKCPEHSDPIKTYQSGKGVCTGRSNLFKVLLSNRYLGMQCYLVSGNHGSTGHQWAEVYFKDGTRLYYDLNLSLNGSEKLSGSYFDINHFDYIRNHPNTSDVSSLPRRIRDEEVISKDVPPLPARRIPPLPPRRVPPLPPRNKEKRKTVPSLPKRRDNQEG